MGEAEDLLERHGLEVETSRRSNVLPLLVPFELRPRSTAVLWFLNKQLSRLPGLRSIANNLDLVATRRG